jgi:lipopolysaccharide transport system permease protein
MRMSATSKWGQGMIYLRDLLSVLVARDMKLRYRRSILGVAWSLLNPLAQLLVLNFVFSKVLPLNIPDYAVFLFIGLLVWGWFQSSLVSGTGSIVNNRELIKRPSFPAGILPIVDVLTNFIHFLIALPILILFMIISQIEITSAVLALPALFAVQFIFIMSLVFLTATVHVTFRDTQYLLGILLLLGFYLSPVFYEPTSIPENLQSIYYLNPMAILIEAYRAILMDGAFPVNPRLALLGLVSLIFLWLGYMFFKRSSQRFVEEL